MSPALPLRGLDLVITRAVHQASVLAQKLSDLGAETHCVPVIEIVDPPDWAPVDRAIGELAAYDWLLFTSANAVNRFLSRVDDIQRSWPRIAVIGRQTEAALAQHGLTATLVPDQFVAEGLLARLDSDLRGQRFLFPRAESAREIIPTTLRERGARVDLVCAYRTQRAEGSRIALNEIVQRRPGAVIFTSASTVTHFLGLLDAGRRSDLERTRLICIGPVTARKLAAAFRPADLVPQDYTTDGLCAAMAAFQWR